MNFLKSKERNIKYFPLPNVISYLKAHPLLLTNERNNYSAEKLMMLLDNEKLAALEDEFNEHQNGIELPNFIWLMKSAITHPEDDKYDLVNGLIKLFQDIDINGDNHMEWSEFTQYIIDAVIGEKDTKFFDARFEKDREFTENEILDRAYSRKTKRYVMSKLFDNTLHSSTIKKMIYCESSDLVLVLEQNSKKIKFYTPECQIKENLILPSEDKLQKAFILDFFFAQSLAIIACISSDRQIFFWENGFNHRIIKKFKTDVLQTGIWYLEQHGMWITSGADNMIRFWDNKEEKIPEKVIKCPPNQNHTKTITEIIEITVPKMIATCSLDGKIKLWDLSESMFISDLKDPSPHSKHSRGIRGATYSYEFGGNLLTFGFENYINVWCPEISKTRSFIGKLEGHSSIIVSCKFIPGSPNVISIDDKTNIRIWDIRTLSTIQILASEQGAALIADVAIITKHDKFVLGGKRLIFYDNSAVSKSIKNFNEDIYCVNVDFNTYYSYFVILTKIDIRIYDSLTGKLIKVFNDLQDEKIIVDLTTFCFGANERKFYIADNAGFIRVFNMKNGEFMKKVNLTTEIEGPEFSSKHGHLKKKENNEISQMIYLREERLLITASWDSTIRIYDESEPEESVLLRVFTGGHQDAEIISLAYSSHLSLLASGSSNGIIAIWDLESGKLETVLLGHKGEINSLEFAEPFPLLISGSSEGIVCVWGVRPIIQKFKYICIAKIINSVWERNEEKNLAITSLTVETEIMTGTIRNKNVTKYFPPKNFENLENSNINDTSNLKKKRTTLANLKNKPKPEDEEDVNSSYGQIINESIAEYNETEEEWEKYFKSHELDIPIQKRRCYVICGDYKGHLLVFNLLEMLNKRGITECEKYKKAQSYQLRRKDLIDATKQVEFIIQSENLFAEKNNKKKDVMTIHAYNTVLFNKWEAHNNTINKITKIKEPCSYVTSSLDKHVKVWNLNGEILGDVNLVKLGLNNFWKFPFDWVKNKLNDIDYVFETLEKIEKERLNENRKNEIKSNFFVSKYLYDIPDIVSILNKDPKPSLIPLEINLEDKNLINSVVSISKNIDNKSPKNNIFNQINIIGILDKLGYEWDEKEKKSKKKTNIYEENKYISYDERNIIEKSFHDENTKKKGLTLKVLEKLNLWEKNKDSSVEFKRKTSKKLSNNEEMIKKNLSNLNSVQIKNNLDKSSAMIKSNNLIVKKGSPKYNRELISQPQTDNKKFEKIKISAYDDLRARTALSDKKRNIFSNLSAKNFFKNTHYIQNMIKGSSLSNMKTFLPSMDIKLREGEGLRALKLATVTQYTKFESESQNMLCDNNDLLRRKKNFYKELQSSGKLIWDQETIQEKEGDIPHQSESSIKRKYSAKESPKKGGEEKFKVIASSHFLHNPHMNKHKILKSKKKIYVIENI